MVQVVLARAEPTKLFFGLSGHRVGVLGLLKTAPSAGSVHVAELCIRDWFRGTPLEMQHKPSNRKQPDKPEGCMNKKYQPLFIRHKLDSNLNYVFAYKSVL